MAQICEGSASPERISLNTDSVFSAVKLKIENPVYD